MSANEKLASPPQLVGKSSRPSWGILTLASVLGGAIAYAAITAVLKSEFANLLFKSSNIELPILLVCWVLAAWLSITMHEVGHLLGAAISGLSPVLLFSGPLQIEVENKKVRTSFNRHVSTWGGLAVAIPKEGHVLSTGQAISTVAGGPLTSSITALIFLSLFQSTDGLTAIFLLILGLMSAAIGIATLIPLNSSGFASDGGQLWQLINGNANAIQRLALATVSGQNFSGQRPKNWDLLALQSIASETNNVVIKSSALLLAAQVLDDRNVACDVQKGFEDLASHLHAGGLASYPSAFRAGLIFPIVIFLAQRCANAESAQQWLEAIPKGLEEPYERLQAMAAICKAKGDDFNAKKLAQEALAELSKGSLTGLRQVAIERLTELMS